MDYLITFKQPIAVIKNGLEVMVMSLIVKDVSGDINIRNGLSEIMDKEHKTKFLLSIDNVLSIQSVTT